jgi:hypothetical protein
MYARLPVHTFNDAMTPVATLVNEGLLLPDEEQLRIHGVTPDRTATVTVALDSDEFTTYTPADQPVGIDATTLAAFLDIFSPTAPLNCTSPPHSDLVTLSTAAMQYRAEPTDPQYVRRRDTDIPPEQPHISVTIPSDFDPLTDSLRAAGLCSQTIRIHTNQDDPLLGFTASGATDSMRYQVHQDDLRSTDTTTTTAVYPLDKLRQMYESLTPRTEALTVLIDNEQTLTLTASHSQSSIQTRFTLEPYATASEYKNTKDDATPSPLAYRTQKERRMSADT